MSLRGLLEDPNEYIQNYLSWVVDEVQSQRRPLCEAMRILAAWVERHRRAADASVALWKEDTSRRRVVWLRPVARTRATRSHTDFGGVS